MVGEREGIPSANPGSREPSRSTASRPVGFDPGRIVEAIARALAKADGKDPDAPAWVEGYGNRKKTFGICWRDQYLDRAQAAYAVISERVLELECALDDIASIDGTFVDAHGADGAFERIIGRAREALAETANRQEAQDE